MKKAILITIFLIWNILHVSAQCTSNITNIQNATCYGYCDGTATVTAIGGVSPYTYLWPSGATTTTAHNLCAGSYIVTVTDANNCTSTATANIYQPPQLIATITNIQPETCQYNNGSADFSISGGTVPYTYSCNCFSNSLFGIDSLHSGTYYCTITDANACNTLLSITIPETSLITGTETFIQPHCGTNDGSVTLFANGSTGGPYLYSKDGGVTFQSSPTFPNLSSNMYSFIIKDSICSLNKNIFLFDQNAPDISINYNDVPCSYDSLTASIVGGQSPFQYQWGHIGYFGYNFGNNNSSLIYESGVYQLLVRDANQCLSADTIQVSVTGPVHINYTYHNSTCDNFCSGIISTNGTGGTPPYSYLWSNDSTTALITNLCPATYFVTITDSIGCHTESQITVIYTPFTITPSVYNEDCELHNGSIYVGVNGGTYPISFSWSNGSTGHILSNVSAGIYTVTISDVNGCIAYDTLEILNNNHPVYLELGPELYICAGTNAQLSSTYYGYYPYSNFIWNGFPNYYGPSINVTPDTTTTYYLTLSHGVCSETDSITVHVMNCNNSISGTVFNDINNNGIQDNGENGIPHAIVQISPINNFYTTDSDGNYNASVDTGHYEVSVPNPPYWYSSSNQITYVFEFHSPGNQETDKNFSFQCPIVNDLTITATPVTNARPGFDVTYSVIYQNSGSTTQSGTIKFVHDPDFTFISSTPSQNYISGDSIFWDYSNLAFLDNRFITLTFHVPVTTSLGTELDSWVVINPVTNDTTPLNNYSNVNQIVTGSYDPNDKSVIPAILTPQMVTDKEDLIYTIRFQNTGTDTAFTIIVRDTLSNKVDVSSFQMLASSHPCEYRIYENGIVEWTFTNILLADSNTNEPNSHGYVKYSVHALETLGLGEEINNTADIYFDFNTPVRTNTITSTVEELLFTNGINDNRNDNLSVYPNPFTNELYIKFNVEENAHVELEIYNILGEKIQTIFAGNKLSGNYTFLFDEEKNTLETGIYLLKLNINGKNSYVKAIKTN